MQLSKYIPIIQTLNSKLLFGFIITEDTLNKVISSDDFPCKAYIFLINQIIANTNPNMDDIKKYKKIFYENRNIFSEFSINKEILFKNDTCVLSNFSCINLIERILKYGKFKNNSYIEFNDQNIAKIVLLNIMETAVDEENDSMNNNIETLELYLSIILYNQFSNDLDYSNFFRIRYLYDNYLKNNIDLLKQFKNYYGYSLKNYLLFLQMFLCLGKHKNMFISKNIFNNTNDADEIIKCIKDCIFDYKLKVNTNQICINSYVPSQILIEKPIIFIDNKYFTINPGFLINRVHSIFFKKIKDSYPINSNFRKIFYGPLFEQYCKDIAKLYCKKSNYKYYDFIDEFKYTIKKNNIKEEIDSSDFYIVYNDTTIIFEIKSTSRFNETTNNLKIENKEKFIEKEIDYKIFSPFKQIENRLSEIKKLNPNNYKNINLEKIQKSNNYFYIIVSEETILNNFNIYNKYLKKICSKYSKHIPIYLNITEFEYLMMSLYKRKKPIGKVLEQYLNNYYCDNFSEMIIKERKTFKFSRLDIFNNNNLKKEIKAILKTNQN